MELQKAIERQRNRVDEMIQTDMDVEAFMKENRKLDCLIAEYIEFSNSDGRLPA